MIQIGKVTREIQAHVLQGMKSNLLLGLDSACLFNLSLDLDTLTLRQENDILHPRAPNHATANMDASLQEVEVCDLVHLNETQQFALKQLVHKYDDIFSKSQTDIGCIISETHHILLTNNVPIRRAPYRCSEADSVEMDRQINDLLAQGVIRLSTSPYAAPALLAEKKGEGRTRFCIDYRKLNAVTVPDYQPIPRIDDVLDSLGKSTYFSTLDITSGYWHVKMHPEDIPKTAFVTRTGHYEWLVMPFGLRNAPATFERAVKSILTKHRLTHVTNYFDDIVVYSDTFPDHLKHLEAVLKAFKSEFVKLKLKKCQFARTSVEYLGHRVSNGTVTPKQSNVDAILRFPTPSRPKELQRFLGTVNVYRRYIARFSEIAHPLTRLLSKDATWNWDSDCELAFTQLKKCVTEEPILKIYDASKPCVLYCDASNKGIGAVLKQADDEGREHPIAYHSRKLLKHEINYAITELECLAIIDAIDKWHCYLHGKPFTVITDHAALQWLKNIKNPQGRLFRWSLKLSMYDVNIKHQKGIDNIEADALSRNPIIQLLSAEQLREHPHDKPPGKHTIENGMTIVTRRGIRKVYVPFALRSSLLQKAHGAFGHVGVKKTLRLLSPQYYWPDIVTDVSEYIRHCDTCQRCKKPKTKRFGSLESLPPAEQPFDLLAMDTIGGFANYGSSKRFIHLAVDHATRYVWAFAHKNETCDAYISCLKSIFAAGKPRKFLSDRGTGFTAGKFKQFLKHNNIHQLFTSSQRPQCNGLNERTNQSIVTRLRCKINDEPRKPWTRLLSDVIDEYNRTPHEVTGYPPCFLMYGTPSYPCLLSDVAENLQDARANAVRNSLAYHEKNKLIYDKKFIPSELQVGDFVLYETPWHPNRGKLSAIMEGPYTIIRKISTVNYEIDRTVAPLGRQTDIVHVGRLRRYHPPLHLRLSRGEGEACDEPHENGVVR